MNQENYYALCICILTERIPDEAFKAMQILPTLRKLKETDVSEILRFKKCLTWKQVGELYGVNDAAIQKRVSRSIKKSMNKNPICAW